MSSPSIRHGRPGFIATFALTLLAATLVPLAQSQQPAATTAPPFPLATGTTFVIAVSNELGSTSASNPTVAQGDYDVVVTVTGFGKDGISQSAFIDADDDAVAETRGVLAVIERRRRRPPASDGSAQGARGRPGDVAPAGAGFQYRGPAGDRRHDVTGSLHGGRKRTAADWP